MNSIVYPFTMNEWMNGTYSNIYWVIDQLVHYKSELHDSYHDYRNTTVQIVCIASNAYCIKESNYSDLESFDTFVHAAVYTNSFH